MGALVSGRAEAPRGRLAVHGTAVCDGGASKHKNGGCVVQQPTVETEDGVFKEKHKDGSTLFYATSHVLPQALQNDHKTNSPVKPLDVTGANVHTSDYHTLSEKEAVKEPSVGAKPPKTPSPDNTSSAAFLHSATQDGVSLSCKPSSVPVLVPPATTYVIPPTYPPSHHTYFEAHSSSPTAEDTFKPFKGLASFGNLPGD